MDTYEVSASSHIAAPAKEVYELIRDYRNGHPNILPKRYFLNLEVEKGGSGAGTRVRFQMRVMRSTRNFVAEVSEPEPGRVLLETDADSGAVTSFTVEPHGAQSHVTIRTMLKSRRGILASVERFTTRRFLRRIYNEELQLLSQCMRDRSGTMS